MSTYFTVKNVSLTGNPPYTITFASLTPDVGTFPTFASAPLVSVLAVDKTRDLDVDRSSITTTQFKIIAGSAGPNPPYTADLLIVTSDVTAAAAGTGTSTFFPHYCTINDVNDAMTMYGPARGSAKNLDDGKLRRFIQMAYGRINAALPHAGYVSPARNNTKQLIGNALTASENVVTLNSVEDGTKFAITGAYDGLVRIHGTSGSSYNDEFTHAVAVNGNVVDVLGLENSYDANSTVEKVEPGFNALRMLNALGASLLATGAMTIGFSRAANDKEGELVDAFTRDIEKLERRKMVLSGLTRNDLISSYVQENPSEFRNDGVPIFEEGATGLRM